MPGKAPPFPETSPEVTDGELREALIFMDRWRGSPGGRLFNFTYGSGPQVPEMSAPMPAAPSPGAPFKDPVVRAFRRWAASRIRALIS